MTDGREEQRREARYAARILAKVMRRGQTIELLTNDVSFRGVFLRTDAPPALRQLVKFELMIPTGAIVSGHAMVVHLAPIPGLEPDRDVPVPGIGLQFWGPLGNAREWELFIHQLRARERAGLAAARVTDRVRRSSERFKLALEVILDGRMTMTRDVSETGMAIRTDVRLPVGARAEIGMRAGAETLRFDVVVRRAIEELGFRGLGVEFADLDGERRRVLTAFVRSHTPKDDVVLVRPGDPRLH